MTGRKLRTFSADCAGAAGAEFAIVLPLLLLFLFGILDVGRYMWSINELEKATQVGARMAVVTDMVPSDLASTNFGATLGQGAKITSADFGQMHCDKFSGTLQCVCDSNCADIGTTADANAFGLVVARMQKIAPVLADTNVRITYTNSGLGYAGDPNGPDVAPIVTVSTNDVGFAPLIFQFFGASLTLPSESASLTLEDASGTTSN
jgi:Flp pilus assembly protein TadG